MSEKMRRAGRRAALCFVALVMATAPAAANAFNKIVDTTLIAPDGNTVFTISQPQLSGTNVVFVAATGTPNAYIFVVPVTGGVPAALVSEQTKVPGGSGTFTSDQFGYFSAYQPPNGSPPVIGDRSVAFIGHDAAGNEGVYSVPIAGGKVRKLADYNTAIPGGPVQNNATFNVNYSFENIAISGDTVVFDTNGGGVYSVKSDGSKLTRIADFNTPATQPPFQVDQFGQPSISGKSIAFVGSTVFGPFGIYVDGPGNPVATAVANSFDGFTYPIGSGRSILFLAHLANQDEGIFDVGTSGATQRQIVDLSTPLPPGTPGAQFANLGSLDVFDSYASLGNLRIFHAETTDGTNDYQGLFKSCGARLEKLLADGDTLDGATIGPREGITNLEPSGDRVTGVVLVGGLPGTGNAGYQALYAMTVKAC